MIVKTVPQIRTVFATKFTLRYAAAMALPTIMIAMPSVLESQIIPRENVIKEFLLNSVL